MRERSFDNATDSMLGMNSFLLSMSDDREDDRVRRRKKIITAAIEKELTDRQRQVVLRYFYRSMSAGRIGAELGISTATVYKHLRRAREKLKACVVYY